MDNVPGPESTASLSPSQANLEAFRDIFPGVVQDGVLDAARLGEALGIEVAGLKDGKERFGLMWAGKHKAVEALQAPSYAALIPDMENSVNWDAAENVFIEGDNLEVLKLLQNAYNDQVKLIYIDPPYNTGNDFVYNDDFSDPIKHYLEVTGQVDGDGNKLVANTEVSGRKHSNWLSMMYPRLVLARNLLTQDGILCISIDDNELVNLQAAVRDVFGEENFLATLIWNKQHSQQQGLFKKYHEYVFVVARDASKLTNIKGGEGFIEAGALKKVSPKNGASDFTFPPGVRFDAPDGTVLTGTFGDSEKVVVVDGILEAKAGKTSQSVTLRAGWTQRNQMVSWFAGEETIDTKGQNVIEFFFNGAGKLKSVKERSSITPPTLLPEYGMVSEQTAKLDRMLGAHLFDNPKPVEMIKDLARWFTSDQDIVLDFFAGSGTTGQAIMELNAEDDLKRKYILVNINEETAPNSVARQEGYEVVSAITLKRLAVVHELYPSSGCKVYRLGQSTFGFPETPSDQLVFRESTRKADIGETAIAAEICLRLGKTLDEPISAVTIGGLTFLKCDEVLIYLAPRVPESLTEVVMTTKAKVVVVLEDSLAGLDSVKANLYFACKKANITFKTF